MAVRAAAGIELTAALAISAQHLRVAAWVITGMLGVCFAALGMAGLLTRSARPCGCFGAKSDRPLGIPNMVAGSALLTLAVVNLVDRGDAEITSAHTGVALLTVVLSLAWALAEHRQEAAVVITRAGRRTSPGLIPAPLPETPAGRPAL
jgi:hypothetical protein